MKDLLQAALAAAKDRWHTLTGLFVALGTAAAVLIITFAGVDLSEVSPLEWIATVAVLLGITIIWSKTRLPYVPKGRVGFGVAIQFEESEHERQLHSDFLVTLRDLLMGSRLSHQFSFVELPKSIANRIIDEDTARWVAMRANLTFLLFGRARLRDMPTGSAHILNLRGLVRHSTISAEASRNFAADIARVLPHRLTVSPSGNIFACEFAAQHIDSVARFIIGTAAALSNDFEYAEELLLDSERRLKSVLDQTKASPISVLLATVQGRIAEIYFVQLQRLFDQYTSRRDLELLRDVEAVINKLRQYDPENYSGHLCRAICAFMLRRDLTQAREEIEACRRRDDAAWMYSEAFLCAYDGDLRNAYRSYRRAFQAPLQDPTVPMQSEEFIQIILDQEPERAWLYYCTGLINYRAKGDLQAARADFATFVQRADPGEFATEITIVNGWIEEIDSTLNSVPPE